MSLDDFDNHYWYADELKAFAKSIGIAHTAILRKDELVPLIREYLKSGRVKQSTRKNLIVPREKDSDIGLRLDLPIRHYTNNKATKTFLKEEARKMDPDFKLKSGAMYRINRWRDEQVNQGRRVTYGDLVSEFVRLNRLDHFEPIKVTNYINFLRDFDLHEKGATREEAIAAWHQIKAARGPKTYDEWKRIQTRS